MERMTEIAPPTLDDILRIPLDPEWAQTALDRWGMDILMDPACEECGGTEPTPCPSCGRGIGLGDIIKRVTRLFGVKPCAACEERARKLNRFRVG